jgi:NADH-quinone oxidoreductase subunit G
MRNGLRVGVIGERVDLTYPVEYLGAGPDTLGNIASTSFGDAFAKAERPLVIVGQGALNREDGLAVLAAAAKLAVKGEWNGLSILHTAASRVGALDLGFVPGEGGVDAQAMANGGVDVLFNLGADEIEIGGGPFVVYIGSHGDRGAHRANVILPGAAYTEKSGTYVNMEGRVQRSDRANFPPGDAREDWAILRALSDVLGQRLPFDSLNALRAALVSAYPHLAQLDAVAAGDAASLSKIPAGTLGNKPFVNAVQDFYLTNPIARASAVMAECSALAKGRMAQAAE